MSYRIGIRLTVAVYVAKALQGNNLWRSNPQYFWTNRRRKARLNRMRITLSGLSRRKASPPYTEFHDGP